MLWRDLGNRIAEVRGQAQLCFKLICCTPFLYVVQAMDNATGGFCDLCTPHNTKRGKVIDQQINKKTPVGRLWVQILVQQRTFSGQIIIKVNFVVAFGHYASMS